MNRKEVEDNYKIHSQYIGNYGEYRDNYEVVDNKETFLKIRKLLKKLAIHDLDIVVKECEETSADLADSYIEKRRIAEEKRKSIEEKIKSTVRTRKNR
jgi:hypothetical protein